MNLRCYRTIAFDCDGVLLDSNRVKTEAFRAAALPYGEEAAEALVQHHVTYGGVSRYRKFAYFLDEIVPAIADQELDRSALPGYDALLEAYAAAVHDGLRNCALAEGLESLRARTDDARWLVISGGDQAELRAVLMERGIARHFDGGIFGSPDSKAEILSREIEASNIRMPALFLGDSQFDYEVAAENGLDFVFVSGWTDMPDWYEFFAQRDVTVIANLRALTAA